MKKNILIVFMVMLAVQAFSQQNIITLSGGYSFANIEDVDKKATGWRINGLYEFNQFQGPVAHGLSFGYIFVSATETGAVAQSTETRVSSVPIYYAPKFMFGADKFKGFVKGALGMQFSNLHRDGAISVSDNDFGFYGGGGGGIMFNVNEMVFINAEYEIAWLSNSYYRDGWMNTAMGGIGIRF